MRIWTINPKYLDSIGLVALWKETILAKKIIFGEIVSNYKNHPEIKIFLNLDDPKLYVNHYLKCVFDESLKRNFNFSKTYLDEEFLNINIEKIKIDNTRICFEINHLNEKLKNRHKDCLSETMNNIQLNSIFAHS